jgi:hypothetical protein
MGRVILARLRASCALHAFAMAGPPQTGNGTFATLLLSTRSVACVTAQNPLHEWVTSGYRLKSNRRNFLRENSGSTYRRARRAAAP